MIKYHPCTSDQQGENHSPARTCRGASACRPDPVRKVPAEHKLHSTLPVAPASPFSTHHTACSAANCQPPGEDADLTLSRKSQPDTSCT